MTRLTGNLGGLGFVAGEDPPADLAARAVEYAAFADEVTTKVPFQTVSSVDAIPWRRDLSAAERAVVLELQGAGRIHAPLVESVDERTFVTRWVLSEKKLIRRAIAISANGAVRREDVVVREALPVR